ncbi:MAG: hypothetical protein MUC38_05165 [Cyclobacteriaceae bacterium]|jgi:hypothetical protein|nr:hypothetical protein [Cyclobacteriaceae bacterium]
MEIPTFQKRVLFYATTFTLVLALFFVARELSKEGKVDPLGIIVITLCSQFVTSLLLFRNIQLKRIVLLTLAVWIISFLAGFVAVVTFAFAKKSYPAGTIAWMSFFCVLTALYELYFRQQAKTKKPV